MTIIPDWPRTNLARHEAGLFTGGYDRPFLLPLFTACGVECLFGWLKIPPTTRLEIRSLRHGERRREARKQVAVVYASFASHALRAHEVLSRPDALASFLEVVHRLVKYGVFFGHERSIRIDSILPRIDGSGYP